MVRSKTLSFLLWLPLLTACHQTSLQDSVRTRLDSFLQEVKKNPADEAVLAAVEKLNRSASDADLETIEHFAKANATNEVAWPLIRLLVVRHRFDSAVEVAVGSLSKSENRQYRMWKWWEHSFGDRKDYAELNRELGQAYLRLFKQSSEATKEIISDIFGRKKLSAQEFSELIDSRK